MQNGKELWISWIYFPLENPVAQAARLRYIVDRGGTNKRARRHLADMWRAGARARRCSLVAVRRMSRARQCRRGAHRSTSGGVMEVKNGDGLSSVRW
jgi:hypothetical protein